MNKDIDFLLFDWPLQPGTMQARLIRATDGREVLQLRVDLGILQLETTGRPDGIWQNSFPTYFEYLLDREAKGPQPFVLDDEQCAEADREFFQFYQRRQCWLMLGQFDRAVADADHTLAFMDFVRDHSPNEEYTEGHEQYRGFVLFQRTQAMAAAAIERDDPESAIDAIQTGMAALRQFLTEIGNEDPIEQDPMIERLREMEEELRNTHGIQTTLREQLNAAIEREDYETAARLRDAMKDRK